MVLYKELKQTQKKSTPAAASFPLHLDAMQALELLRESEDLYLLEATQAVLTLCPSLHHFTFHISKYFTFQPSSQKLKIVSFWVVWFAEDPLAR